MWFISPQKINQHFQVSTKKVKNMEFLCCSLIKTKFSCSNKSFCLWFSNKNWKRLRSRGAVTFTFCFFLFLLFVNQRCSHERQGGGWVNTDTPGYLAETEHTHRHTHTPIHIQSFWVMGTRWCARTVFILYGFLFECVLLTGLLMASSFPGQGSAIRPYPGHAKRARTPENKVADRLKVFQSLI